MPVATRPVPWAVAVPPVTGAQIGQAQKQAKADIGFGAAPRADRRARDCHPGLQSWFLGVSRRLVAERMRLGGGNIHGNHLSLGAPPERVIDLPETEAERA